MFFSFFRYLSVEIFFILSGISVVGVSDGDLFSLGGEGSLSDFVLSAVISRQRKSLSVFLSRRKKNSEKERPLRGFRREVRFIMSPPGKRRHNELNAAPPPETPRRTGKPGAASDRGGVQSGESFRVRVKKCLLGEPHGTISTLPSPPRGRCPKGG